MKYRGYTINLECVTDRAVYTLTDDGRIDEYVQDINNELEPEFYNIVASNGDVVDWVYYGDGIKAVEQQIDNLIKGED